MNRTGPRLLSILWLALASFASAAGLTPQQLHCEHRENPFDIDLPHPHLSWILQSDQRGQRQTAYRVLVASTPALLAQADGDLWDSGKVASDSSIEIEYAGKPLTSMQPGYWKTMVWDKDDHPSDWCAAATWTMGVLSPADWHAKWIGANESQTDPLPIFRKEFSADKPLKSATATICGLGQFELHLNGSKVGDDLLRPGWTDYSKTCLYVTYDITSSVRNGVNAVGVMLGNGMYNVIAVPGRYTKLKHTVGLPAVIGQIHLLYADGSEQWVGTNSSWKTTPGPIVLSQIYGGEDYDARREQSGWDQPGFSDVKWTDATEENGPGGALIGASRGNLPIRQMAVFKPVSITQPTPGVWVYDMGQNCAIVPKITVEGPTGSGVRITPAEELAATGLVSQSSTKGPAFFTYTLRGNGPETWNPKFGYMGSRYLQVDFAAASGASPSALPKVDSIESDFISSTSPAVGDFSCSNELFNRTNTLIRWAIASNLMSVITDCPHRERLGWLEQDNLNGPGLMHNFDLSVLFSKISWDMTDAQLDDGLVPEIAPEYTVFKGNFRDSAEWGSSCILVPWQDYQYYGDGSVLRDHYQTMKRYVAYLTSKAKDHIVPTGLGDWFDLGPKKPGPSQLTPPALTATATYYHDVDVLAKIARILGNDKDAEQFTAQLTPIRDAYNKTFYHSDTHQYATASQTANAISLEMGLAPPEDRAAILQNIVNDVRSRQNSLTAGDVGFRYLVRALADGGRSDVVFDMNSRSDRPGYGYQLAHGATSLTESWDARSGVSQDHFMLGHIMDWFYTNLAGLGCADDAVGFDHIVIKPAIVGDVTWAKAKYESVRGEVSTSWQKHDSAFQLDMTIPPGADAMVFVPASSQDTVREGADSASAAEGVRFQRMEGGAAVFAIESGSYSFKSN